MAPNTASAAPLLLHEEPAPLTRLSNEKLTDVLRLMRTPNVGPVTFFYLLRRFGSASAALERLPEIALRGGGKTTPGTVSDAESEIEATGRLGARFVVYGAPDYPPLLLHTPDPPPVIAVRGDAALWQKPCLGVVGARNASAGGCSLAQKLSRELGNAGLTIVSGLARGIDTFAHKGSLATGTVAVIASGIDIAYPPENAKLMHEIAEKGAVISEQPFGAQPFAGSFPGRNRIIAGMSLGTLVVEATQKSGSLITARFAAEQGREIFAIPGSPLDPRASGPNALLKQGAHLVENAADILEALPSFASRLMENEPGGFFAAPPAQYSDEELAKARDMLLEKTGYTPVAIDELLAQCPLPAGLLLTALMELELAGRIERLPGNRLSLRPL